MLTTLALWGYERTGGMAHVDVQHRTGLWHLKEGSMLELLDHLL